MKDKKIKVNKKRIIVPAIILIVAIGLICTGAFICIKHLAKNSSPTKLTDQFAQDILYNNYLLSYILEGDIKVSKGAVKTKNGEIYYAVKDPLLENIKSIEDISKLASETLLPAGKRRALNHFNDSDTNKYLFVKDMVYVQKTKKACEYTKNPVKKDAIKLKKIKGKFYSVIDNKPYQLYKDKKDENKYKLSTLLYICSSNDTDSSKSDNKKDKDDQKAGAQEKTTN